MTPANKPRHTCSDSRCVVCNIHNLAPLNIREVARHLRVSPITVYRTISKGKLPAFKVGDSWRVHKTQLERWMLENSKT